MYRELFIISNAVTGSHVFILKDTMTSDFLVSTNKTDSHP